MADATAASIAIECNDCGARMRVPSSKAGKRGKCPKCGGVVEIPSAAPPEEPISSAPAVTADGRIRFACDSCGKSLKVPAAAAGRRVKCPKCQAAVSVPDPNAATDDQGAGEDDLFAGIAAPTTPVLPFVPPPAPPMGEERGARRGGGVAGATAVLGAAGAVGGAVANPVILCILGSALGAAVGAAIWCAVAYYSHVESGWIAWGVGGLAGLGAILGARDSGSFQGLVATGMAGLGIIAGKFAVFYLILQPFLTALNEAPEVSREQLANLMAQRAVEGEGVSMEQEDAWDRAMAAQVPKAEAEVAKMSDKQVADKTQELAGELRDEFKSEMTNAFWKIMFGPFDILFFGLALFTAYRIGNGGFGGGED